MRVKATVTEVELISERGYPVNGVQAECSRCEHETESYGTSEASIKRCLALLREECPRNEKNYYGEDYAPATIQSNIDTSDDAAFTEAIRVRLAEIRAALKTPDRNRRVFMEFFHRIQKDHLMTVGEAMSFAGPEVAPEVFDVEEL